MGCDIHVHVEYKKAKYWEYFGEVKMDRSYVFFAALANVRNEDGKYKNLFFPKGMPDGLSLGIPFTYDDPDYHSHSWLSTSEYRQVLEAMEYTDDTREALLYLMEFFEDRGLSARIVFWFDN